jgi:hypothetical protein
MSDKKHNYPKTRKPRDTSYSTTYKILAAIGKDKLFAIWQINGHIKTAAILEDMLDGIFVSPMVIQYIAQRKFGWKRIVTDKNLSIYKAVLAGTVDPSRYKTIIFA